jgi:hypothetical protein
MFTHVRLISTRKGIGSSASLSVCSAQATVMSWNHWDMCGDQFWYEKLADKNGQTADKLKTNTKLLLVFPK